MVFGAQMHSILDKFLDIVKMKLDVNIIAN